MPMRERERRTQAEADTGVRRVGYHKRTTTQDRSMLPQGASLFERKVTRSGHISYEGHSYFVSKTLAGRYIQLVIAGNRLIIDAEIPVHKEYTLVEGADHDDKTK